MSSPASLLSKTTPQGRALHDIMRERDRQDAKWGVQNHNVDRWIVILAEEFGEMAMARNDEDRDGYRSELVQVAAVATAMLESLDRGNWT